LGAALRQGGLVFVGHLGLLAGGHGATVSTVS
jgi:hypothetical protein